MHLTLTYPVQPGGRFFTRGNVRGYCFGFNGQMKDDEVYGEGNSYTAEYWQYDPRLGRRWNVDPVDQISISNYSCFSNNPIFNIDPDGSTVEPSKTLTESEKKQLTKTIVNLANNSKILYLIYRSMDCSKAVYNIGSPLKGVDNPKVLGSFQPVDRSFLSKLFNPGADYTGVIRITKNFTSYDQRTQEVVLAEEFFHAGQDLYRRSTNKKYLGAQTSLQYETEVRVFRAYSGLVLENEGAVSKFAKNTDVVSYFDALRNSDNDGIKKHEEGFRKAVGILADEITSERGGYSKLRKGLFEYKKGGNETPFFDLLTKEMKLDN